MRVLHELGELVGEGGGIGVGSGGQEALGVNFLYLLRGGEELDTAARVWSVVRCAAVVNTKRC